MKPDWYKLAQLLEDNKDVRVALCDTDANECDPKYYWEGSIPTIKLFVKGKKKATPLCYQGERQLHDWMRFLAKECKTSVKDKNLLKIQFATYAQKI